MYSTAQIVSWFTLSGQGTLTMSVDYLVKQFLQTTLSSDAASVSNMAGIYISDITGNGTTSDYSQDGTFTKNSTIFGNVDSLHNSYTGTSDITVNFNEDTSHYFMFGAYGVAAGIVSSPTYSSTSPVPEPATILLFSIGLVSLAGISRKRKN
jgi:hypothetical protein